MTLESLALSALAIGLGGLVKGATGFGLPLVAVPILASFLGVPHAIAVMMVPILVTNAWQIWTFRLARRNTGFLPVFLAAGTVGVVVGTWVLAVTPGPALMATLGVMLVLYVALALSKPTFQLKERAIRWLSPPMGVAAGILQGMTGIGAPVGGTFIHAMRLGRERHVFAVSAMFLTFGTVQTIALAFAGILTWSRLLEGAFALLPAMAMMPLGAAIARLLSPKAFDRMLLAVLALIGAQLLVRAVV
jgi:uncharacterized protein